MIRSVIYEHTNFCLPHHVLRMHTLCALVGEMPFECSPTIGESNYTEKHLQNANTEQLKESQPQISMLLH